MWTYDVAGGTKRPLVQADWDVMFVLHSPSGRYRVHAINEMFCNPGFFDKTLPKEIKKLEEEQKSLGGKIDEWMAEWAKLEEELQATPV